MTEFSGEYSVDLGSHHAAFLIGCQCRVVFVKPFPDDVGVDLFGGAFDQLRLGVDGLSKDVIAFEFEFCRQVLEVSFPWLFRLAAGAPFALLSSDSFRESPR